MARKRKTAAEKQGATENVLWMALGVFGGKYGQRDLLQAGARHEVALSIAGSIDDAWIETSLEGRLLVNHDQQSASSTNPNYVRLVALLLEAVPDSRRHALIGQIAEKLAITGELPQPGDPGLEMVAEAFLARLRQKKTITKRGSVRFDQQPLEEYD